MVLFKAMNEIVKIYLNEKTYFFIILYNSEI